MYSIQGPCVRKGFIAALAVTSIVVILSVVNKPVLQRDLHDTEQELVDLDGFLCKNYADEFPFTTKLNNASLQFHALVSKVTHKCQKKGRFGRKGDGGYYVCLDEAIVPHRNNCLVYSFGVRDDWSFDESMQKTFGCEIHSFDPSVGKEDHKHSENMFFHNLGLSGVDFKNEQGWQLNRLSTIIEKLGHTERVIDVLKVDIEGSEWPMLCDLLSGSDVLHGALFNVKQLILELHTPLYKDKKMTVRAYRQIAYSMTSLDKLLGFRNILSLHNNGCCARFTKMAHGLCCYETFYVNSRFL